MMHGFQQIVTQAERPYNFVVHGLPPLGDEMGVSPLIWRKKLMDSISGNLGYLFRIMSNVIRPSASYAGQAASRVQRVRPHRASSAAVMRRTPPVRVLRVMIVTGA